MIATATRLREATVDDLPEIGQLWLRMVDELLPGSTPNLEWWTRMAKGLFLTGLYVILIAEADEGIIGYIDFMLYPEPSTGKIHGVGQQFYVLPEHRHHMIAAQLYKRALTIARNRGAHVYEFFCAADDLKRWLKKGYQPVRVTMRKPTHV
jgi:GNAT superfamily N-acetyltransferase